MKACISEAVLSTTLIKVILHPFFSAFFVFMTLLPFSTLIWKFYNLLSLSFLIALIYHPEVLSSPAWVLITYLGRQVSFLACSVKTGKDMNKRILAPLGQQLLRLTSVRQNQGRDAPINYRRSLIALGSWNEDGAFHFVFL